MIKKLVLLLMSLAALYGAIMSPFSLPNTLEIKASLETALASKENARTSMTSAKTAMVNAKNAFESQRTFDIHYSDLAKIKQLFDSVSGVSFSGLAEIDPDSNYALGVNLDPESYADGSIAAPKAVRLSIVAENTVAGLKIIDRLELPIVSILTTEPGRIEVIFLTGGDN